MPLVSGATAAGFHIVRLLGGGQIGELYLADHPRLPRQYALKIVLPELSADPEYRYRFRRESDQAAALWHPNIVSVQDRGEFEDQLWLSMDYIDGTDAAHLLANSYTEGMPPELVVEIVSAVADALDYAHEQGLVHRYVNPSNILLSNSESTTRRISLAGFGLARRADESNTLTRRGLAIGTASYAAPEQLMDDSLEARTDQYALACTAFHLLTGSPPFAHMNPNVLISRHLNGSPPQPGDVKPALTYFDAPFNRALMKSPTERFRRCRDFARALESKVKLGPHVPSAAALGLLTETGGAALTTAAVTAPPEPVPLVPPEAAAAPTPEPAPTTLPEPPAPDPDAAGVDDATASPDVLPEAEIDDASVVAEHDVWSAETDSTSTAWNRRRTLQTAGLGITIIVVALGGILGVMALRSAAKPDETSPNIESPPSVTGVAPARTAPATAIPPPMIKPRAPKTTTPPVVATTTSPPTSASEPTARPTTQRSTTQQPTTQQQHSTTSTTGPGTLDTRPAVGMPCGAPGATATSNSGAPVACVDTPGGSAWEPPGG
jgi:serine/threonine protein kinase, bacterial